MVQCNRYRKLCHHTKNLTIHKLTELSLPLRRSGISSLQKPFWHTQTGKMSPESSDEALTPLQLKERT